MIYSSNYFAYEQSRVQAVPIRVFTDLSDPIGKHDPRIAAAWWPPSHADRHHGRLAGAWWKTHPNIALPDAPVTIWLGGNFIVLASDLAERCLEELGDDDVLLMRHPWRDDLLEEERESHPNPKYDGQATAEQVQSYLDAGHPQHFGLAHGGFLVRRNTPEVQERLNDRWWAEILRWSIQDQLSLPYVIRTSGLRWHWWPAEGQWRARPFDRGWFTYGTMGIAA